MRNCGNYYLSGLQIAAPGSAIVVNGCEFLSPTNSSGAGLVITAGKNATVTNCIATGITNGGGLGISISGVTNNVTLQSCTITTNENNNTLGGGPYVSGAVVVALTNCFFTGNTANGGVSAYGNGGGAYCSVSTLNLSGNTFIGNSAFNSGGGVYCSIVKTATLSGNTFTGNSATADFGGGVYCASGTNVSLTGNTFTGNSANSAGGGVYCPGLSGSGSISLTNNIFTGNSVLLNIYNGNGYFFGGGFCCFSSVTNPVILFGNTFQKNLSQEGGGLYVSAPNINLIDNLVVNNTATNINTTTYYAGFLGGGIWVDASATLNMINNTVTGNSSKVSGGGVAYIIGGTVEYLNVFNNIIWGNSATNGGDVYLSGTGQQKIFSYNDVHSQSGPEWDLAQGLIDLSPQFLDSTNGNYHLQSSSPCIAAGSTGAPALPATDLDGNTRTDNGKVDMGCYEFTASGIYPADVTSISRNANGSITLNLVGTPNATSRIWATTNLASPIIWQPIFTNYTTGVDGTWQFIDTNAINFSGRFYRFSTP